jgi:hypothetical protein
VCKFLERTDLTLEAWLEQNAKRTYEDQGNCLEERPDDESIVCPSPADIFVDETYNSHQELFRRLGWLQAYPLKGSPTVEPRNIVTEYTAIGLIKKNLNVGEKEMLEKHTLQLPRWGTCRWHFLPQR